MRASERSEVGAESTTSGHTEFQHQRHFGSLDGLRALSVLAVIWHHTVGHDSTLPLLFSQGAHGVTLFFAISGFLIVTLLLRERATFGTIDLRAFYIRRTLRIFPLFYAVLLLYTVLVLLIERHTVPGREFLGNLIFFATYTANWFVVLEGRVIFYFAWSLAAEEQFYLVWPWIQRVLTPSRALGLIVVTIVALTWLQWGYEPEASQPLWRRMLGSIQLAICLGVLLAHLLHAPASYRALRWVLGWRASSAVIALACLIMLNSGRAPAALIHLGMAMLVGACVYREDHWLAPLLRTRVLVLMGSISYGMYLLHMLVKNAVAKALGVAGVPADRFLIFGLTLVGTVAVAWLSFRYFESHFMRMKARFSTAA